MHVPTTSEGHWSQQKDASRWHTEGLRLLNSAQDLAWRTPLLPHRPHTTPRDRGRDTGGLLFLFTKTLLSDMLDKKKLQPQSSYAEMIEEHAIIFHTSRTFNEFFF